MGEVSPTLIFGGIVVSQAIFTAIDPNRRTSERSQLSNLLADIRGVLDWQIDSDGQVIVNYNHEETSSNVIEEALAGVGYRVKHVRDDVRLGDADAPNLGVERT